MKRILTAALMLACIVSGAQTREFKLGKWTEIQTEILKELQRSYVDSLPVDRIERMGVDAMLEGLDPYTIYVPAEENENLQMIIHNSYGGIGAMIYKPDVDGNVIINEPYENSPAHKYGLECCDEIMEIDGESVIGLTSLQASEKMRGDSGTKVTFKVKKRRGGEIVDIPIVRERIHLPEVTWSGMLEEGTGYICLTGFSEGVGAEVRSEVARLKKECGMRKLILDLRGNGGGLLREAVDIVSIFVPKGSKVVTAIGKEEGSSYVCKTTSAPVDTKMQVVVLINSASASASEIVAGALQDLDRATIMGQRSYGKGLVQSIRDLPYGGQLKVTTAKYYTPSGRCVQAIDYSHRAEDGSVGYIPDSLTHEFTTAHGRTVRDGGGITPDVTLEYKQYSRLTYSLVMNGVIEQYTLDYVRAHESIPAVADFHFDDFDGFVEYAKGKTFDYRSSARAWFDRMKEDLETDGLAETMKPELDAMEKALEMDKETFLRLMKDEIVPFIEEEIAVRYYFQRAGMDIRIRYDDELREALASPCIQQY